MVIKKMKKDDYDEVYRLWTATPGMGLNDIDDSWEGIEKFLKRNPETCFTAFLEEQMVGVIMAGHDGRRGHIYHMAVSVSSRKNGIGTALLDKVLTALRDEGIIKVSLVAFEKNEIGNSFWEKRGFGLREDLCYRDKMIPDATR